jgi:hypothetical protein
VGGAAHAVLTDSHVIHASHPIANPRIAVPFLL